MKKVGIMSMQRIINYGSFLQAYGLYSTIKKMGYNVEFIDFHYYGSIEETKKISIINKIVRNLNIVYFYKKKKVLREFRRQINNSLAKLNVLSKPNYNHDIDSLVIGSDEVFNCMQGFPIGYSLDLFGKGYEDKNVISYAASFGYTDINKLEQHNKTEEIAELLKKFKSLSVRDNNSSDIIKKICDIEPYIHLDPVLISDYGDMNNNSISLHDYIIVYAYAGRLTKKEKEYIKSFSKKNNKKIVSLGFYQKIADYNLPVNPFEVLPYFKNADFVITDTFHGTIFSIKSNTKFCTIVRDSNRNKIESLLNKLSQENRMVTDLCDIEKLYNQEIDFSETNKIIEEETKKAVEYLKNNL